MKFNNSVTWSYSNRSCYISRFKSIQIVLIFFVCFWVRNSCIETLAERIELADFNFWFCNEKTFSCSAYNMGAPSRWAVVALIAWIIFNKVSNSVSLKKQSDLKISFLYIIFLDEPFANPIRKGTIKEAHSFRIELIHSFRLKWISFNNLLSKVVLDLLLSYYYKADAIKYKTQEE